MGVEAGHEGASAGGGEGWVGACDVAFSSVTFTVAPERLAGTREDRARAAGALDVSTTLNIYAHVVDASHRKAMEALERELFPSVPTLPGGPKPASSASRDVREV